MAPRSRGDLSSVWKALLRLRRWAVALMLGLLATYTVMHVWRSELTARTSAAQHLMFNSRALDVRRSMRSSNKAITQQVSGQGSGALANTTASDGGKGHGQAVGGANPPTKTPNVTDVGAADAAPRRTLTDLELQMGLPKVALMFLSRGHMRFEAVWRAFLSGASGVADALQLPLQPGATGSWEWLFTIYVHARPGYTYPPHSLFAGQQTTRSVAVTWGQHSVIDAERLLLADALGDRLNARFLLLSESCLPLYPASTTYLQMMSLSKSSINACAADDPDGNRRMTHRWQPGMERPFLSKDHWRKSGQWFMLTRPHAQLVAVDNEVAPLFEEDCWSGNSDRGFRFCVADEHYVPTLLASKGLDSETDCAGSMTSTFWEGDYMHPKTWHAVDLIKDDPAPFWAARRDAQHCKPESAMRSATDAVLRVAALRSAALASTVAASASSTASAAATVAARRLLTPSAASSHPSDPRNLASATMAAATSHLSGKGGSASLELRRAVWGDEEEADNAGGAAGGVTVAGAEAAAQRLRRLLQEGLVNGSSTSRPEAYLLEMDGTMGAGAERNGGANASDGAGDGGVGGGDSDGGAGAASQVGGDRVRAAMQAETIGGGAASQVQGDREWEAIQAEATAAASGGGRDGNLGAARSTMADGGGSDDGQDSADPNADDLVAAGGAAADGGGGGDGGALGGGDGKDGKEDGAGEQNNAGKNGKEDGAGEQNNDGKDGKEDGAGEQNNDGKDGEQQGALVAVGGGGRGFALGHARRGEEGRDTGTDERQDQGGQEEQQAAEQGQAGQDERQAGDGAAAADAVSGAGTQSAAGDAERQQGERQQGQQQEQQQGERQQVQRQEQQQGERQQGQQQEQQQGERQQGEQQLQQGQQQQQQALNPESNGRQGEQQQGQQQQRGQVAPDDLVQVEPGLWVRGDQAADLLAEAAAEAKQLELEDRMEERWWKLQQQAVTSEQQQQQEQQQAQQQAQQAHDDDGMQQLQEQQQAQQAQGGEGAQQQQEEQQEQQQQQEEPAPPPPPPMIDPDAVKAGAESAARLAESASREDPLAGAPLEEAVGDREEEDGLAGTAADPWSAPAIAFDPLDPRPKTDPRQQQQPGGEGGPLPGGKNAAGSAAGDEQGVAIVHHQGIVVRQQQQQQQQLDLGMRGEDLVRALLNNYRAMPERCPLLARKFSKDAAKPALAQLQGDLDFRV